MSFVDYRCIEDAPGYMVGSDGTVWSSRAPDGTIRIGKRRLSTYRRPYGAKYVMVCLRKEVFGKVSCHYVHRLVLDAFVGPCPEGMEACHNNGDTSDNRVENLRWDTHAANIADKKKHGTANPGRRDRIDLSKDDVSAIINLRASGVLTKDIATKFEISPELVRSIVRNKRWRKIEVS